MLVNGWVRKLCGRGQAVSQRGASRRPHREEWQGQADLFSVEPGGYVLERLASLGWPAADQFPVNHSAARVRTVVWKDLVSSESPLIVAGFSSIAELVDLIAAWDREPHAAKAKVRVLLGTEPFASARSSFASAAVTFTDEVRRYWLEEEGVSLRLSAKVLQVLKVLDEGRLEVRFVDGPTRLHAKIYVGAEAATTGSSNFTSAGLGNQIEANSRFERCTDALRYRGVVEMAENCWTVEQPWNDQFRELLLALLRFVPWQEALARACSDLLDGAWAKRYLSSGAAGSQLWPSQMAGIAQALWIVENVGSVLVADATGSGKTRMGAHLVRAVRDRLWSTGRVRRDLTVLVRPPSVENTWYREGGVLRCLNQHSLARSAKPAVRGWTTCGGRGGQERADSRRRRRSQLPKPGREPYPPGQGEPRRACPAVHGNADQSWLGRPSPAGRSPGGGQLRGRDAGYFGEVRTASQPKHRDVIGAAGPPSPRDPVLHRTTHQVNAERHGRRRF